MTRITQPRRSREVGADVIALDHDVHCGTRSTAVDDNSIRAVTRHDIALQRGGSADRRANTGTGDINSKSGVGNLGVSCSIESNDISAERIVGRSNVDPHALISRDHVASTGHCTADRVATRVELDVDPCVDICNAARASGVCTDVVALHQIPGRRGASDENTVTGVAGDNVTGQCRRATDRRARDIVDVDARVVSDRCSSRSIQADSVSHQRVVGCTYIDARTDVA